MTKNIGAYGLTLKGLTPPKEAKRGTKSKNCIFLRNIDPFKFSLSVGSFFQKIDWNPWGDPVRGDPDKRGSQKVRQPPQVPVQINDVHVGFRHC